MKKKKKKTKRNNVDRDWMKFREQLPQLTMRGPSLRTYGKLYAAHVRSTVLHLGGMDTWAEEVRIRRSV